jgi:hypothetical protein
VAGKLQVATVSEVSAQFGSLCDRRGDFRRGRSRMPNRDGDPGRDRTTNEIQRSGNFGCDRDESNPSFRGGLQFGKLTPVGRTDVLARMSASGAIQG